MIVTAGAPGLGGTSRSVVLKHWGRVCLLGPCWLSSLPSASSFAAIHVSRNTYVTHRPDDGQARLAKVMPNASLFQSQQCDACRQRCRRIHLNIHHRRGSRTRCAWQEMYRERLDLRTQARCCERLTRRSGTAGRSRWGRRRLAEPHRSQPGGRDHTIRPRSRESRRW